MTEDECGLAVVGCFIAITYALYVAILVAVLLILFGVISPPW